MKGSKVYKYNIARKLVKIKEISKDQERAIQSNSTPDLHVHVRLHMGKRQNKRKHHTQETEGVMPFPAGDHKKDPQK